ncbi:hypothetical protein L4X34_04285, partial [Phocaeicola vulgatus]|uniref:hypothetical protein n=1 Tax=Phocaeicola vulgatus TaxID=821 RepID=UPI001F2AD077
MNEVMFVTGGELLQFLPISSKKRVGMSICFFGHLKEEKWLSRFLAGIIFYTREVLLTSHYEKRLFEHASQPRVACADIRLL